MTESTDNANSDAPDNGSMEEYVGRCKAVIIELTGQLPAEDLSWAMRLVDHGEAPEGLCVIARALASTEHPAIEKLAPVIRDLMSGLVPDDALPSPFRSTG